MRPKKYLKHKSYKYSPLRSSLANCNSSCLAWLEFNIFGGLKEMFSLHSSQEMMLAQFLRELMFLPFYLQPVTRNCVGI